MTRSLPLPVLTSSLKAFTKEEPGKVLTCDSPDRFQFPSVKRSKATRRLDHPCRFVTLATKRNRGEIRTVSFNQQPIQWQLDGNVAQIVGLLKSEIAGE